MKDPLGVMGKDSIFVMESFYDRNFVEEYENMAKLKAGVTRKTYRLPYVWSGTGAVVYGSYLYYNRSGNILVFVNKLTYVRSKYSSYFYLQRLQIDELEQHIFKKYFLIFYPKIHNSLNFIIPEKQFLVANLQLDRTE